MRWQIPQDVVHRGDGFLLVAVSMSPCAERRWRKFGLDSFGFWISSRRISMTPLLLRAEMALQKIWPPTLIISLLAIATVSPSQPTLQGLRQAGRSGRHP